MRRLCGFAAVCLWTLTMGVRADEPEELPPSIEYGYVQVWLGTTDADESWSVDDSEGDELLGDFDNLPLGGGVGQRLWGERGQYGFEGGGLVSWRSSDVAFSGADPGLRVAIDTELILVEVFMGGVIAVQPTSWLRLFASAGPSIAYGRVTGDDDDEDDDDDSGTRIIIVGPNSFVAIDGDETSTDFSFSAYARAGLEFVFRNGVTLGASVRYTEHEFDFGSRGDMQLDEVQWFLTVGGRI